MIYICEYIKKSICCCGVFLMRTVLHENQLTHTDLKPENILFLRSDYDVVPGPKRPYGKKVCAALAMWN